MRLILNNLYLHNIYEIKFNYIYYGFGIYSDWICKTNKTKL